jgi:hypothetical protein
MIAEEISNIAAELNRVIRRTRRLQHLHQPHPQQHPPSGTDSDE